jgi:hypothetical protein
MRMKTYFAVTIIVVVFVVCTFIGILYGGEKKVNNNIDSTSIVPGKIVKSLLVAFDDYTHNKEGYKKEIEFYDFEYCLRNNEQLKVEILLNSDAVSKEVKAPLVVGGGAEYTIDLNSMKIIRKMWYK